MLKQLVLILTIFAVSIPVWAQEGTYNLVIDGVVTNDSGSPAAFKTVQLMTGAGEGIEVSTDGTGHFTLIGTVRGSQGTLIVKSAHADNVVFGTMPLSWSAGGFGDKHLAADLTINTQNKTMMLTGGGTENLINTASPADAGDGNDMMTVPTLPTITPIPDTPAVSAPATVTVVPVAKSDNGDSSGVILMGFLGVFGIILIGSGLWWLVRQNKGQAA